MRNHWKPDQPTSVTSTKIMNLEQLKEIIGALAKSQGSYGRMQQELNEGEKWEQLLEIVNKNNVRDAVDLVMLIEN